MQQQLQHSHLHQHQHPPHPHQQHIHNNQSQRYETQTQIRAYEGLYRQIPMSDYSCPNRVTYSNNSISSPIRLSFVTLPDSSANNERICFNYGRELFIYVYKGVKKTPDLKKLVEKKVYKGINPTCHDFNQLTLIDGSVLLLIGLSSGQIQLIDPIQKDIYKIFNEDRLIEKTKVTCIRWIPRSKNEFLVSHASGNLYVYHADLPCYSSIPTYQIHKEGSGFQIQSSKSKCIRNPVYRWSFPTDEDCCINEFAFSPCGSFLAIVSQDGFLRVFDFQFMELQGFARSYFGGFLCVCWSPDSRYIVVGGQDDLVTIWSFHDKCVLARGQAHKSWVSVVAFDPFMTNAVTTSITTTNNTDFMNDSGITFDNEDLTTIDNEKCPKHTEQNHKTDGRVSSNVSSNICYRFGSVGQDTQLCLWDITEDILNPAFRSTYRNCSESTSIPTSMTAQTPVVITPSSTPTPTLTTATSSISAISVTQPSNLLLSTTIAAKDETKKDDVTLPGQKTITAVTKTTSNVSLTTAICSKSTSATTTSNSPSIITSTLPTLPTLPTSNSTDSGCDTTDGGSESRSKHKKNSALGSKENHFSIIGNISSLTQKLKVFNFNERKSEKRGGVGSANVNFNCNSNLKCSSQQAHVNTNMSLNTNINSNKTTHSTKRIDQSLSMSSTSCTNQNSHSSSNINSNLASCCSSKDGSLLLCDPLRVIGTSHCPRFDQCPIIEPLVCEKIAHECLTALVFREDCFVTACQDGCIYTWARPNKINVNGDMFCRYETD